MFRYLRIQPESGQILPSSGFTVNVVDGAPAGGELPVL
jgi:hypothetical protein